MKSRNRKRREQESWNHRRTDQNHTVPFCHLPHWWRHPTETRVLCHGVYSKSCPLSRWCHPTIILCCPLLLLPSIFPSIRVFSNESVLCMRWPEYWSFSSASVLPMNIQDWFPFGWTCWISLQETSGAREKYKVESLKHMGREKDLLETDGHLICFKYFRRHTQKLD